MKIYTGKKIPTSFNLSDCERNFLTSYGNGSMTNGLKKILEENGAYDFIEKRKETDKYMLFEMRTKTIVEFSKAEREFLELEGGSYLVKGIRRIMVKCGFEEFLRKYHNRIDQENARKELEKVKIRNEFLSSPDCPF